MTLRGMLLVWIGLMGLAGTGAARLLVGAYPRAFADLGPAVAWPWRRDASRVSRVRGAILVCTGVGSLVVVMAGIVSLLS